LGTSKREGVQKLPSHPPQLRELIIVAEVMAIPCHMCERAVETSENNSNSVMQLTDTIILILFSKHEYFKWYVMLTSRKINFLLYVPPLLFYFASKLLNRFCLTLHKLANTFKLLNVSNNTLNC
jgi:hypothetical protein